MKKLALAAVMAAMLGSVASAGQVTISNAGSFNVNIQYNENVTYLSGQTQLKRQNETLNIGETKTFNTTGPFSVQVGCAGYGYNSHHTDNVDTIHTYGTCTVFNPAGYNVSNSKAPAPAPAPEPEVAKPFLGVTHDAFGRPLQFN